MGDLGEISAKALPEYLRLNCLTRLDAKHSHLMKAQPLLLFRKKCALFFTLYFLKLSYLSLNLCAKMVTVSV